VTTTTAQTYDDARRFLAELPPKARVAVSYHGDADGTGSAALAVKYLERTGREVAGALAPSKGEDLYGEAYRERLLATRPDALLVLDHGSRHARVLGTLPTLVVDHHDAPRTVSLRCLPEWPSGDTDTDRRADDLAPAVSRFADLSDAAWYMAVGVIGDLGLNAPFDELTGAKKQFGQKHLTETVALVNAAKRSGAHDTALSLQALLAASAPREIASGLVAEYDQLAEYRQEVQRERLRIGKTAPRFAGDWALLRFSSPCQLHGPFAASWVGRLPKFIVISANEGYTPGNVHFSVRTRRPGENLLLRLRAFREELGMPELGQGHAEATGGVLPIETFERLLGLMGF
jgi:single-stranded DNA-specific DHH superfamily exonuclease